MIDVDAQFHWLMDIPHLIMHFDLFDSDMFPQSVIRRRRDMCFGDLTALAVTKYMVVHQPVFMSTSSALRLICRANMNQI
jgi:hypothetical protein